MTDYLNADLVTLKDQRKNLLERTPMVYVSELYAEM